MIDHLRTNLADFTFDPEEDFETDLESDIPPPKFDQEMHDNFLTAYQDGTADSLKKHFFELFHEPIKDKNSNFDPAFQDRDFLKSKNMKIFNKKY